MGRVEHLRVVEEDEILIARAPAHVDRGRGVVRRRNAGIERERAHRIRFAHDDRQPGKGGDVEPDHAHLDGLGIEVRRFVIRRHGEFRHRDGPERKREVRRSGRVECDDLGHPLVPEARDVDRIASRLEFDRIVAEPIRRDGQLPLDDLEPGAADHVVVGGGTYVPGETDRLLLLSSRCNGAGQRREDRGEGQHSRSRPPGKGDLRFPHLKPNFGREAAPWPREAGIRSSVARDRRPQQSTPSGEDRQRNRT